MSNKENTTIDLVKGPKNTGVDATERAKHWSAHINLSESEQIKQDIVAARKRLGQFSARFVVEAICAGEPDGEQLAEKMLAYIDDPDQLIDQMKVDPRALKKLAQNVGGQRADRVVQNSVLREVKTETGKSEIDEQQVVLIRSLMRKKDLNEKQIELLRTLMNSADPSVIKRALSD